MLRRFAVVFNVIMVCALAGSVSAVVGGPNFRRGDANNDGNVNISDPVYISNFLFQGGPDISCYDAADANDSGTVDVSDIVFLYSYLFQGGAAPPNPGPTTCGPDPTSDSIGCLSTICP